MTDSISTLLDPYNRKLDLDNGGHFVAGSVATHEGRLVEARRLFSDFSSEKSRIGSDFFEVNAAEQDASEFRSRVDISWLPSAADTFKISPDIGDYLITTVGIVTSDIPNKNMQGFTKQELTYFDPIIGRPTYKTFIGAGLHYEHQNKDPLKAKGVILDSMITYIPKYDVFKVLVLAAWDRTKDVDLVKQIMSGERAGYSMGCMVKAFVCAVSGQIVTPDKGPYRRGQVVHVDGKRRLCYHLCTGSNFFEMSSVGNPADVSAIGDRLGVLKV